MRPYYTCRYTSVVSLHLASVGAVSIALRPHSRKGLTISSSLPVTVDRTQAKATTA